MRSQADSHKDVMEQADESARSKKNPIVNLEPVPQSDCQENQNMLKNIVETWQIDPDAGPDNLEAKQPFIDNGLDVLDPARYYAPEFMAREWENCGPGPG